MSLKIANATKRFGSFTAVDHIYFEIDKGEIFGFLGANGAGKTTTFRMILGILDPTEGEITWNGKKIDYSISGQIGYLPEERGLYPKLKVSEQMVYLASLRGMAKKDSLRELDFWLEKFRIEDYKNKKVEELSKGNQQKIQYITSVIHKPDLLILDEPFSGLDPVNVDLLKEAILYVKNLGTTIIFSSHQMDHVEDLCENLCIMDRGKPVVQGKLKEIKKDFGRKNLTIHADFDCSDLKNLRGVTNYQTTAEGVRLQIIDETVVQQIQGMIFSRGFIRKFQLDEPSLHEIFIEKVGTKHA